MSNFRFEVLGAVVSDTEKKEAVEKARFLQKMIDCEVSGFEVKVFDYETYSYVSLAEPKKVNVYTGRQESEGMVQGLVRSLVQSNLISADVNNHMGAITSTVVQVDESRHYSPNYSDLHDKLVDYAVNAETFALDFKNALSDALLNSTVGGSPFMKKAKASAKQS